MSRSELIYQRRTALGLTLEQVATLVGVSKSTVKKWENGSISNMRRDRIARLAEALQVSPMELISEDAPSRSPVPPPSPKTVWLDRIAACYDALNELGQQVAVERIEELSAMPRYQCSPASSRIAARTPVSKEARRPQLTPETAAQLCEQAVDTSEDVDF